MRPSNTRIDILSNENHSIQPKESAAKPTLCQIFLDRIYTEIDLFRKRSIIRIKMELKTFYLKDCNLSLIATGITATSLNEFRDMLYLVPDSSIYYHFWGNRLRLNFAHPEYHNDFSRWAHFDLHDEVLTERLAIVDPTDFLDTDSLRKKVIEVVEERIDEIEYTSWSRWGPRFHFLRSITIVYDMGLHAQVPSDLKSLVVKMPPTSIFYHFIDARRRTPKQTDDFSYWLTYFDGQFDPVIEKIKLIDPYFLSLSEIKQKLTQVFTECL
jgi:hypothetical protein